MMRGLGGSAEDMALHMGVWNGIVNEGGRNQDDTVFTSSPRSRASPSMRAKSAPAAAM